MSMPLAGPIAVDEMIKIAVSLSTERDIKRLLEMIVLAARTLTHAEAGSIYLLDHTKQYIYAEVYQNDILQQQSPEDALPLPLFVDGKPNLKYICTYCACTGHLVQIPDIYRYSGFDSQALYAADKRHGYRTAAVLAVPLRSPQEITLGVLQLTNFRDPTTQRLCPFPSALANLVTAFASQAAVALDNARLLTENQRLVELLDRTNRELAEENQVLRQQVATHMPFPAIIGRSPRMQQVLTLIRKVCETDATVLLRGETGTGKELLAQTIHQHSLRQKKAFVSQNCAATPEALLESEFFGYRRGAFTGAMADKKGLLEEAHGGTLFLDEIGDMPLAMQAKLLRVLQEKEIRPLGDVKSRQVDLRVITATHRDLQSMVAEETFRADLYFRLCVFPIDIPPLRERPEDLPAILAHMLSLCTRQHKKTIVGFTPRALDLLLLYTYPGNVRELKNIVERAVLLGEPGGNIDIDHLPPTLLSRLTQPGVAPLADTSASLPEMVRNFEKALIEQTLREHNQNQTKTAAALHIPRRTLIEKMQRYGIRH